MKHTLIGTIALVVIVSGIATYALLRPAPVAAPGTSAITEESPYFSIDAKWPATTSLKASAGAAADKAAVALMAAGVQNAVAQFKSDTDYGSIIPADAAYIGLGQDGRKYTFDVSYEATSSPTTVSYIFSLYADTLGAHGNGTYLTYTFDAKTGAPLSLSDLFTISTNYVGFLSAYARANLPAVIAAHEGVSPDEVDSQMLDEGTAPDAANFQWFYLANGDLVLLFPPYAVAPYAAGTIELDIPLSQVTGLKAGYP
ncbi:MAG TPA: RsiV family protein [Candidatus Paceibacterota bacterium]|nr:RsiV family protein [Candidatus Paceibacterota bacterium]